MTDCEKKELVKSLAMGMSFEEISNAYGISEADVTVFYSEHKGEVEEEMRFLKGKRGG